jgi:hypothetical protein
MGYSEWGLLILLYNLLVDKIWGLVMTEVSKDITDLFAEYPCKIENIIKHLQFLQKKGFEYLYFDGNEACISVYYFKNGISND